MALSPAMLRWVSERVYEAHAIMTDPNSTPSQRDVAKLVLAQWKTRGVVLPPCDTES